MVKVFCKKNAWSFGSLVLWLLAYKKTPYLLKRQTHGDSAYQCVDWVLY